MNEKTKKVILKHFCLDGITTTNQMVCFPEQKPNSLLVLEVFDNLVVYCNKEMYEDIKIFNNLQEITNHLKNRISSIEEQIYYFFDSSTKLNRRYKRNVVIKKLSKNDLSALDSLEKACTYDDLDSAYITIDDFEPYGIFQDQELMAITSLIKVDEMYDLGIITRGNCRNKGYGKSLLYQYLKEHQDKIIRLIVSSKNISMINLCKSIGLENHARLIEIKYH